MDERGEKEDANGRNEVIVRRGANGEIVVEIGEARRLTLLPKRVVVKGAKIESCCLGADGRYPITGRAGDRALSAVVGATENATGQRFQN
jgi:hypothetical protein